MRVLFCLLLPNIQRNIALFEGSEALPSCNSDKNIITMKMNMEY